MPEWESVTILVFAAARGAMLEFTRTERVRNPWTGVQVERLAYERVLLADDRRIGPI